nr:DUF411 domain-containing protein [Sphingomonas sp. LHG3406-1]
MQAPDRRQFLVGSAAAAACMVGAPALAAPARPAMTVYRDPGCGCCSAWADVARKAGYKVTVAPSADMAAVKRRLGVPDALASCHTTVVGGLVVEGHVPMPAVAALLQRRPRNVKGIAVPGMPAGSPGMEVPGGRKDPFDVIAFDAAGRTAKFAS